MESTHRGVNLEVGEEAWLAAQIVPYVIDIVAYLCEQCL